MNRELSTSIEWPRAARSATVLGAVVVASAVLGCQPASPPTRVEPVTVPTPPASGSGSGEATAPRTAAAARPSLAVGHEHACFLDERRQVWCWGDNQRGQLGDGTQTMRTRPVKVALPGATRLVAAAARTCAILEDGSVSCWGGNLNDPPAQPTPAPLEGARDVVELALGWLHVCWLDRSGRVTCRGLESPQHPSPAPPADEPVKGLGRVKAIDAVVGRTCALDAEGGVWCWRGLPARSGRVEPPKRVEGLGQVVTLDAGFSGGCAIDARGGLWAWGERGDGGGPETGVRRVVVPPVRAVSADDEHACAIDHRGKLWCWGDARWGKLGTGGDEPNTFERAPTQVPELNDVTLVYAGLSNTCAVHDGGKVSCWGHAESGQLGNGTTTLVLSPQRIEGLPPIREIAATATETCALARDDQLWCWPPPAKRKPEPLAPVASIGSGSEDICAALKSGEVECRPSVHSLASAYLPVAWTHVRGLRDVERVVGMGVTGGESSRDAFYALHRSGTVSVWDGAVEHGPYSRAIRVAGIPRATAIGGNEPLGCALDAAGDLGCWTWWSWMEALEAGRPSVRPKRWVLARDVSRLEGGCVVYRNGTTGCLPIGWDESAPAGPEPRPFTDVIAIDSRGHLALRRDGTLQMDEGPFTLELLANQVVQIAYGKGGQHWCALTRDAKVWCWGENSLGVAGPPLPTHVMHPVEVEFAAP